MASALPALPTWAQDVVFEQVTAELGLDHEYWSPGTYGPGVAAADYDQDGDIDIFVSNDATGCKLFRNNGDGSFTDIAPSLGLDYVAQLPPPEDRTDPTAIDPTSMMPSFLDTDNDGDKDLFLGCWSTYNRFYENNGDGTFTDITHETFLDIVGHTATAAFADFNRNGRLDVYMVDWGGIDHLFQNKGNNEWRDVSDLQGIYNVPVPMQPTWCAIWYYHDHDPYLDLFVGNDFGVPNFLYINLGGQAFQERAQEIFPQVQNNATMGQALGDYDHDGDYDLFVTNSLMNNLYRREDDDTYVDLMRMAEFVGPDGILNNLKDNNIGWFCDWPDLNNDGWEDLFLVNGYILLCPGGDPTDPACMHMGTQRQSNRMWLSNGDATFTDVTDQAGFGDQNWARTAAVADFDGDGRLDIYLVNSGSESMPASHIFYRNRTPNTGNWLIIRLEGVRSNRDGIGARVRVRVGDYVYMRDKFATSSYLSQPSDEIHIGLGDVEFVDRVKVIWPLGDVDIFENVATNQRITIVEGSSHDVPILRGFEELTADAGETGIELEWTVDPSLPWERFRIARVVEEGWRGSLAEIPAEPGRTTYRYVDRRTVEGGRYRYRISGKYGGIEIESQEAQIQMPIRTQSIALTAPHPNPFNPRTMLRCFAPEGVVLRLQIVDVRGRHVADIPLPPSAGWHDVTWDGQDHRGTHVASGSYRAVLSGNGRTVSTPLTLVR